jgi:hypothetical protein
MNRRSFSKPVGVTVVISALAALPPAASGQDLPGKLGEVQRTLGEAISQPSAPPSVRPAPAAREPSRSEPRPSAPASPARGSSPSAPAAPPALPQPAGQAGGAPASAGQGGGSPGGRAAGRSSSAPAAKVAGQKAANPTDAPDATGELAQAETDDLADEGTGTLPFTGSRLLQPALLAVLLLVAGFGLRRAVRDPA